MIYKIGAGAGNISINGMGGYKSGDVLDIVPGVYGFLSFSSLEGISITASSGKVTFSSQMSIANNNSLTIDWSNLIYTGTGTIVSGGQTNNIGVTFNNVDLSTSKATLFIDATGASIVYNGQPTSTAYTNLAINNIKVGPKTMILQGTYEGPLTLHNIIMGLSINGLTIINDGTGNSQKIRANSVYGFNIQNVTINGPSLQQTNDIGIFQFEGFGTLLNIQRNGGWGYIMRLVNIDITGKGASFVENILDVNSTEYGTIDDRTDNSPANYTGVTGAFKITGCPLTILHVTAGNKRDAIGYVTPILLSYGFTDAFGTVWPVTYDYCFGFNNVHPANADNLNVREYIGVPVAGSHNLSIDGDVSAYVDVNFAPVPGSPLIASSGVIGYVPAGFVIPTTSTTSTSTSTKATTTTTSTTLPPTTSSTTTTTTSKHIVSVEIDYSDGSVVIDK